jgi:hypothetical protein
VNRAAVLLLALGLCGACPLGAWAEEPPVPPAPPVTDAAWNARDFEGKWVLFRASEEADAEYGRTWFPFLEGRQEWDLLEWAALTSSGSPAVTALANAKRPTWVRAAVWNLGTRGSHKLGTAEGLLRKSGALVRGWFALHPSVVRGKVAEFAKQLAKEGTSRDDAGAAALARPYAPARLLAALRPPPEVVVFGDRLKAEPGVTYVHQVERALAVLNQGGLEDEGWTRLHADLLRHPVREVRRAAALAASERPPEPLLETALLDRLDAPEEAADVQSAALLALASSREPSPRLLRLAIGADPKHASFTAAVSALADVDDGFALELWKDLDASPAGPEAPALLAAAQKRLAQRLAARTPPQIAAQVAEMLDLAAFADVGDHPLKGRLVPWTLETVKRELTTAGVREALQGLLQGPVSAPEAGAGRRERARQYARELLSAARAR